MKKKKLIGCIAMFSFALSMTAHTRTMVVQEQNQPCLNYAEPQQTRVQVKATNVDSPIVTEKGFVWYTEQRNAWKEATQRNPHDENAWLNYYNATRYMSWFGETPDSLAREVIREMGQAIPDTYTYNMCAYMAIKLGHGFGTDGDSYAEAALTMLPDDLQLKDYNEWVCYLAMKADTERMAQMAKRFFDSGLYSEAVLRYSYNELAGMDEGGIYLSSGDAAIIPKWLIQEGMGLHRDKTIVCISFLAVKEYREWLSHKLNVDFPSLDSGGFESYGAFEQALLQAIIDRYGSKVYFSTVTQEETFHPWKHSLYNEGLLMKYSAKPYDNRAVKRRNVEERYMLEYLLVSFQPDWTVGQRLSANYAIVLADLLPYYAKHDKKRYDWLRRILENGVSNTSLSEERKQEILQLLK